MKDQATVLLCAVTLSAIGCAAQQTPAPLGRAIEYKTVGGRSLHLYVNAPAQLAKARAVVMFFHGGGWIKGSPSSFNTQSAAVAARGAVAIEVEYRLLEQGKDDSEPPRICVEDTKSALRYVRSHAVELGIDPKRVAAVGGSAGGYDAAYAALLPGWDAPTDDMRISARPDALVLLNPVLDIRQGEYGFARFGEDAPHRSPLLFATSKPPPTLMLAGTSDTLARPGGMLDFDARMKAASAQCTLIFYEGQGHGFFNREPYLAKTTAEMLRFLNTLGYVE